MRNGQHNVDYVLPMCDWFACYRDVGQQTIKFKKEKKKN